MRNLLIVILLAVAVVSVQGTLPWEAGQWAQYKMIDESGEEQTWLVSIVRLPGSDLLWMQMEMLTDQSISVMQMGFDAAQIRDINERNALMLEDPQAAFDKHGRQIPGEEEAAEDARELRMAMIDAGKCTCDSYMIMDLKMYEDMAPQTTDTADQTRLDEAYKDMRIQMNVPFTIEAYEDGDWPCRFPYTLENRNHSRLKEDHTFSCTMIETDISENYTSSAVPIWGMVYFVSYDEDGDEASSMILEDFGLQGARNAAADCGEPYSLELDIPGMLFQGLF